MKRIGMVLAVVFGLGAVGCAAGAFDTYGTTQQGYASAQWGTAATGTGVYVNGTQLTDSDKAQLDAIVGQSVPAGRYWMDAAYNFGYEGQPASVNLRALAEARQQQQGGDGRMSMYSTDTAGNGSSIVSDGNGCTILSTPSGSLSSGC